MCASATSAATTTATVTRATMTMTRCKLLIPLLMLALRTSPSFAFAPSIPSKTSRPSSDLPRGMVAAEVNDAPSTPSNMDMPEVDSLGVYNIKNGDQHKALIAATKDKMLIMKVFAPWCRACKGLEPKFNMIVRDTQKQKLPIVFADFTIQHNKDYIKSIGVLALPTVQFYVHGGVLDNFPCGPSKVPILKRKLEHYVNQHVDTDDMTIIPQGVTKITQATKEQMGSDAQASSSTAVVDADAPVDNTATDATAKSPPLKTVQGDSIVTPEQRERIRANTFLADLSDDEFTYIMAKAKLLSFDSGSIIMREGNIGRTFYIITEGEVEICQKTSYEDPLNTPAMYLGTVINRLEEFDFFGERALITEEPRAASIRASSSRTKCIAFDKDDFPSTSILSGRSARTNNADAMEKLQTADDKYGVGLKEYTSATDKQYGDIAKASQVRGSVNRPDPIAGVDNDDAINEDITLAVDGNLIIPLLMRFKLVRLVTRCFDYIMANKPRFGEDGSRRRRSMLVKLLTPTQHVEFTDAFTLIDEDGDGTITLVELRRIMNSVSDERSDDELTQLLATGHGQQNMTYQDFMGLMAEAEFYHLFLETFQSLDTNNSGFVRAKDLDRALCGIRDLISDDRKSIIDVDDGDILVDYEQFSKMLLGSALK